MLPPATDNKHEHLCGIVTGILYLRLPSHFNRVLVHAVGDGQGAYLAGCLIEVDDDAYELEIRTVTSPAPRRMKPTRINDPISIDTAIEHLRDAISGAEEDAGRDTKTTEVIRLLEHLRDAHHQN